MVKKKYNAIIYKYWNWRGTKKIPDSAKKELQVLKAKSASGQKEVEKSKNEFVNVGKNKPSKNVNSEIINQIVKIQKDFKKNVNLLEKIHFAEKNIKHNAYKNILHDGFLELIRLTYILEGYTNTKNMTFFSDNARHLLIVLGIEPQIQNKWIKKSELLYEINDHSSKPVNVSEEEFDLALAELISSGIVSEKFPQSKSIGKDGQMYKISFVKQKMITFVQRHYYYIPK